jgi:predicted dehydrogenase
MNSRELEILVETARENNVFLMEAIWTRFLPSTRKALELANSGVLGRLVSVYADFGFRLDFDPSHRLYDPAKGGGALLDIGVYPVFISLLMGGLPETIKANARFTKTNVDHSGNLLFEQAGDVTSSLNYTLASDAPTEANILFEKGWIRMESWWLTPGPITLHRLGMDPERFEFPEPGNGYHYEAAEVMRCMDNGLLESPMLPLEFSIELMSTLDSIRKTCDIHYEQDNQ